MNRPLRWNKFMAGALAAATIFLLATSYLQAQSHVPNTPQRLRESLGSAMRIQQRYTHQLMADPDIVGTAVGLTENGEPAIKVFTKSEAIMRIPVRLEGMPVEIEATGRFEVISRPDAGASRADMIASPTKVLARPVPIGVSAGNEGECSSGTIGARVIDSGGTLYALGNNHVFALENTAPIPSNIVQPGLANTKCVFTADRVIAILSAFVPIDFAGGDNTVDAAIAASDVSLLGNSTARRSYGTPTNATEPAFVGQKVQKQGGRSGRTRGKVKGINATVLVEYESGTARFVNQIIVGSSLPFIRSGDSGSLLVTSPDRKPVGLLFAKGQGGRTGVANPIDLVLSALGVSIDGQ
jgi:hypothetical protein